MITRATAGGAAVTRAADVAPSKKAFDVNLSGPLAVYTRCSRVSTDRFGHATKQTGCDIYRYDLRTRRERKLTEVSSPRFDEAWPVETPSPSGPKRVVVFVRRARAHVIAGHDLRPDPTGRGTIAECDIPYINDLSYRAPSKRLDRSECAETTGMAIRYLTIAQTTNFDQGGAGSVSQVRRLFENGGAARIVARTAGGEDGYSPFVSPISANGAFWVTRTGGRRGIYQGFVHIKLENDVLTTTRYAAVASRIARDEEGLSWYIEGSVAEDSGRETAPYCRSPGAPCQLILASGDPFISGTNYPKTT